jgi:predicted DNA-binding transcriptional regulator AlpA
MIGQGLLVSNSFDTCILPVCHRSSILLSNINRTKGGYVDIFPTPSEGRADAARSAFAAGQRSWVAAPDLAAELGISRRTLTRWLRDERLAFPRPRCVNLRLYFERGAVDAWKVKAAVAR